MQLSEQQEQQVWDLASRFFSEDCDHDAVVGYAKAVLDLRAQADARPVAWMDDGSTRNGSESTSYRVVTDATKRNMPSAAAQAYTTPLYTHPEASAPGLSDGDLEQWAEESMRKIFCTPIGEPIPEELAVEKAALLECVQSLLTRASAATVAEASSFRASVEAMVRMLEEGEWAEHVAATTGKSDPLLQRLETAITGLINETHGDAE